MPNWIQRAIEAAAAVRNHAAELQQIINDARNLIDEIRRLRDDKRSWE